MKSLIYKELKLSLHPMAVVFALFGIMLLIPSYPYLIPFAYIFVSFIFIFAMGRENHDLAYTMLLPVRKRDVVRARFLTIVLLESLSLIFAVPFAVISSSINPAGGNPVFLDANMALFGAALGMVGLFNLIFLPAFYKTAYKLAKPFIYATAGVIAYGALVETTIQLVPALKATLDGTLSADNVLWQGLALAIGLGIWVGFTWLAYHLSCKRFELVDIEE